MEQEMTYIYTVYKCGNFSKAAQQLYITQPALSIAVRRAEEALGAQIFDRSSRTLKLTEAGELYIRKYRQIRDLERELKQQISDLSSLRTGSLRVGGTNYFNSYILPPVIVAFKQKYPGIDLKLSEAGSYDLLDMLKEHRIDLTFNCGVTKKDPFLQTPCFEDAVLLCVPKSFDLPDEIRNSALTNFDVLAGRHLDESTSALPLSTFMDLPFILLSPGNNLYERSLAMFEKEKITPHIVMNLTQLATAWHLSSAGLGATLISDHLVTSGSDSVMFFRISSPLAVRKFDLIMSEKQYVSNAMKAFSQTFLEYYGSASEKEKDMII